MFRISEYFPQPEAFAKGSGLLPNLLVKTEGQVFGRRFGLQQKVRLILLPMDRLRPKVKNRTLSRSFNLHSHEMEEDQIVGPPLSSNILCRRSVGPEPCFPLAPSSILGRRHRRHACQEHGGLSYPRLSEEGAYRTRLNMGGECDEIERKLCSGKWDWILRMHLFCPRATRPNSVPRTNEECLRRGIPDMTATSKSHYYSLRHDLIKGLI